MDSRRIQVIKPATGGAFGNRMIMEMGAPSAVILAERTGRPVKLANTRTDEIPDLPNPFSVSHRAENRIPLRRTPGGPRDPD